MFYKKKNKKKKYAQNKCKLMCVPDLDNQVYFFNHYFQHNVLKHFSQNGKTNDLTFI